MDLPRNLFVRLKLTHGRMGADVSESENWMVGTDATVAATRCEADDSNLARSFASILVPTTVIFSTA